MSTFELGPAEIHYAFDAETSCVYRRDIIVFDVAFSFSVLDIPVQKVYNNFDVTLSLVGFPKQDWFEFDGDGLGFKLKDTIYRCSAASAILSNIKEVKLLFLKSNDMYVSSTFRDSCNLRVASFSIIGNSIKQEPVGVSIKMELDSPRMNLTWSEHYAHTLSKDISTKSIDYTFTCEEQYPFWKFIDGEDIGLNFDSGVLARVGVEDTVVNNIKNRKVFDVESSSSYAPADACTYERECAAIDYDVRGLTGQGTNPIQMVKWKRFGGFFELNSSTMDYEAMFGEVEFGKHK